jgi:ATP-dependent RNA circularization protein (DNA/RNA ligase family)
MSLKKLTLEEFKDAYDRCGESIMELAHIAVECVSDDDELVQAAKQALKAEDKFATLLSERDIQP